MFKNQKIEQYNQELQKLFEEEKEWFYNENFKESGFIQRGAISDFLYAYKDDFSENAFMLGFDSLACYSIDRAIYFLIFKNEKEKFLEHFSLYSYYSYITIHESSKACKCVQSATYLEMQRISNFFASNIIARQWDKVGLIGTDLINSLNAEGCIIRRGDKNPLQAWFLIELFSKCFEVEINKKRAFYPKDFRGYEEILKKWNSTDLIEIDKFVYNLCDLHLDKLGRNKEEQLKFLEIPQFLLFPFEIIAWLRLRELKGLKNPKSFTHPLMNEPVAKTLLKLDYPIDEPNEVPFLNEFLEPIYKHCPDMQKDKKFIVKKEITETINSQIIKKDNIAPKSASYEAILPPNHPDSLKLKESAFAYLYYEKGVAFSYEGLEEFDINLIKWVEKKE